MDPLIGKNIAALLTAQGSVGQTREAAQTVAGLLADAKRDPSATFGFEDAPLTKLESLCRQHLDGDLGTADFTDALKALLLDGDRYQVVRVLGEGAMGQVVLAVDALLARDVAIKTLKAGTMPVQRFQEEAHLTAGLEHPHIVPVHDYGSLPNGTMFFAMKRVDGSSLREALVGGELTLRRGIEVLRRVVEGVAFAHSEGVVHRDLKPDNVMLGGFGEVLVMDWGVARRLRDSRPHGVVGTPAYMAPEVFEGAVPDASVDIYALGCMLYEILGGTLPFRGSVEEIRGQKQGHPGLALKGELGQLVAAATALDPVRRPTALELGEELDRYLAGEMLERARYSMLERARRWASRHRTVLTSVGGTGVAVGAVAAAVVVTLTVGYVAQLVTERAESDRLRHLAEQRAEETLRQVAAAELALGDSRSGERRSYYAAEEHYLKAREHLEALGESSEAARLGMLELRQQHARVKLFDGPVEGLALSPDGRELAMVSGGELSLWDVASLSVRSRRAAPNHFGWLDGAFHAARWDDGVLHVEGPAGFQIPMNKEPVRVVFPGSCDCVVVVEPERSRWVNLDGTVERELSVPVASVSVDGVWAVSGRMAYSPDDEMEVPANGRPIAQVDGVMFVMDQAAYYLTPEKRWSAPLSLGTHAVDSSDGEAIVIRTRHSEAARLLERSGLPLAPLIVGAEEEHLVHHFATSVAFTGGMDGLSVHLPGPRPFRRIHNHGYIRLLAVGEHLGLRGTQEGALEIFDVVSHATVAYFEGLGAVRSGAFSPDGRFLALGLDASVAVMDLMDGKVTHRPQAARRLHWGADGLSILTVDGDLIRPGRPTWSLDCPSWGLAIEGDRAAVTCGRTLHILVGSEETEVDCGEAFGVQWLGEQLVVGLGSGEVGIWSSGTTLERRLAVGSPVVDVAVHRDKWFATAFDGRLWVGDEGAVERGMLVPGDAPGMGVTASENGVVLTGNTLGMVHTVDLNRVDTVPSWLVGEAPLQELARLGAWSLVARRLLDEPDPGLEWSLATNLEDLSAMEAAAAKLPPHDPRRLVMPWTRGCTLSEPCMELEEPGR